MKINLTSHIDTDCSKKFNIISNLDNILELYFKNKSYDENLEAILVSIIGIKRISGYENWYKPRRPRYTFHKQIKSRIIKNNIIEINHMNVSLDYQKMIMKNLFQNQIKNLC